MQLRWEDNFSTNLAFICISQHIIGAGNCEALRILRSPIRPAAASHSVDPSPSLYSSGSGSAAPTRMAAEGNGSWHHIRGSNSAVAALLLLTSDAVSSAVASAKAVESSSGVSLAAVVDAAT